MRTFRLVIFLIGSFALSLNAYSLQEDTNQRFSPQEFMKRQEAFISREAGLTQAEADAFFPLMREKEKKARAIRKQMDILFKKSHEANLTEKECNEILNRMGELDLQKTKLENSYRIKYKKALSAKKILKVSDASAKFDRDILRHMMGRPWPGRDNNRGNR